MRSQEGGQGARSPSNWNATNEKNDDAKPMVSSVSVSFSIFRVQQYTRKTAIGNNTNIDDLEARVPSI